MPRGIVDYSQGRIYQIVNDIDDDVYIGSTCNSLSNRMCQHKVRMKQSNCENRRLYQHIKEIGIEHFRIELIEYFPCETKEQLHAREGQLIRQLGTLNCKIEGRTKNEYNEDNKEDILEKQKQYYEAHKAEILEKQKQYYEANKEALAEKKKQWYEAHKEDILEKNEQYRETHKEALVEKQKQYREANKDEIAERQGRIFECPCGSKCRWNEKARHFKSKKHMDYMANQTDTSDI
jgi:hypothetical protein